MRDPDLCEIKYCGYKSPQTPNELEFEILGLETAIYEAKKRMSTLRQSSYLVKVTIEEGLSDNSNIK